MILASCFALRVLNYDGVVEIMCSGVTATVFGATGFLGRYVVQLLGKCQVDANLQKIVHLTGLCVLFQLVLVRK